MSITHPNHCFPHRRLEAPELKNGSKLFNTHVWRSKMNKGLYDKQGIVMVAALFFFFLLLTSITDSVNAELMIYPAQDQTPEQQQKDEFECHQWAVGQAGYDPTMAQQAPQQQATQRGGAIRGAAGGALLGVGIGAIAGDAGKGAAIGAGAGAVGGGARQRQQNQQKESANQQAQADQQALLERYNKARSVCLEGKGYTVK